jgi:hypothetical protein
MGIFTSRSERRKMRVLRGGEVLPEAVTPPWHPSCELLYKSALQKLKFTGVEKFMGLRVRKT